jgi:hypothetical protein
MPRGFNDYDTARLQGRLWTPAVLRPTVWLDAADISTISIATGVSEWRDKSNNGWNVVQATAGNQPAYTPLGLNGLSVVNFSVGKLLQTASNFTLTGDPNITAIVAYRKTTNTEGAVFGWGGPTLSSPGSAFGYYDDGTNASWASAGGASYSHQTPIPQNNEWGIASFVKPAGAFTNSTSFRNGATFSVSTGANAPNILSQPLSVGRWADYVFNRFAGDVAELLVFSSAFASRDRWGIEGYLSWKWGIPLAASHPYANRPPLIGD